MNNSTYISANSENMFDIAIPTFDSGAISTGSVAPEKNVSTSEFSVVANKSLISFGVMLVCIIVFLIFVLIFKNKKQEVVEYKQSPERKGYQEEKNRNEQVIEEYEQYEQYQEHSVYRHSSKKRSSLSTPTSINKCIKAFLENTREN